MISAQTVSITSADNQAAEVEGGAANGASITITRNPNNFAFTTEVTLVIGGTAVSGQDYTAFATTVSLNIFQPAGVTIPINVIEDDIVEELETITISLGTITNGTPSPTQNTVTINLANSPQDIGVFTFSTTDADAAEEGSNQGRYLLTLDKENGTGQAITVAYTLGGTATNGGANSDYTTAGQAVWSFPSEAATPVLARALRIIPNDDDVAEPDETVTITLSDPSNTALFSFATASVPLGQRTITIVDNDCTAGDNPPTLNNDPTAFCDTFSVALDDYVTNTAPADSDLVWSTNADPTVEANWIADGGVVTTADTYYGFFADTDEDCYSPTVEITITNTNSPTAGSETQPDIDQACNNETDEFGLTFLDLEDLITGQDAGDWAFTSGPATVNPSGGNDRVNFSGQPEGEYVYTYTTNTAVAPCTDDSILVTIVVRDCDPCEAGDDAPVLDTSIPRTFCDDITTSLNDYAPNTGPNGTVLRWATDQNDPTGSFVPNNRVNDPLPGTYYGFYFDATNDCASPLLTLNLIQNSTPEITSTTPNERCGPGTMVLGATASLDATIRWYDRATGGTPISTGASFTTPNLAQTTSYYVEASVNACTSSPRLEVLATVVPQPTAGAPENTSSCNDLQFGVTTLDLDDTFTQTPGAGAWAFSAGPVNLTANAENIVDFQGSPNGTYVFTYTTTGAEAPCENESVEISVTVTSCDTDDDGDGLLGGLESTLGTDPNNIDTDGDGINDGVEVGDDTLNPLDADSDGVIDALDSNILDTDMDGVVDQLDPANDNPCIPDNSIGLCDTDEDGISDGDEEANGTDPLDACDPDIDNANCDPTPIDLEVIKTVDKADAVAGDEVVFTIRVNNLSNKKARRIVVGDLLTEGFGYKTHDASEGSYDVTTGTWSIFEITPAGAATLTITADVLDGGPYNNIAELLESFPLDENPANDTSEVILNVDLPEGIDLRLEKLARIVDSTDAFSTKKNLSEVNPLVGEEVIFVLRVINESVADTVSNVQVLDAITAFEESGFDYLEHLADKGEYNTTTGIWVIPELVKNEVAILEIKVRVPVVGEFVNTAEIIRSSPLDSEENYENNIASVNVNVSDRTDAEIGIIFNQFSPNNDGTNDELKINKKRRNEDGTFNSDLVDLTYDIKIFNRYGSLVFEGNQMTDEVIWDGSRDGQEVPDGTYFYVLDVTLQEEVEGVAMSTTKKGWIQLIR